ncbi:MAG: hypothetical protein LUI12_03340 [Clostridiales bacterium]|nr:hypothetical protein [Clostridiales bacterium]
MTKYKTFEELKKDCKAWVEAGKRRGAQDGLKKLLTELYPDKAHFIYELLQNAEDKEASEVFFELYDDKLVFTHNGKKRDFTLDDIDSITNIGHSTSADDPTAIGQFGVGFKAVYSYTDTPEIHSGKYDFKIIDMLVPEDEGVKQIAKEGITKFIFPFDNPKKLPQIAVSEIKKGLEELNETAILFLTHIKKIGYILPNKKRGSISIVPSESINFLYKIKRSYGDDIKTNSYWCRFSQACPMLVPDKGITEFPISIAYRMKKSDSSYEMDDSLKGKVCIFFPSEIESSLHFHINAPFASTVARDNIRDCQENNKFILALADLAVKSLYDLKDKKLLNYSVYKTLPELRDYYDDYARRNYASIKDLKPYQKNKYAIFADKTYREFLKSELFITEDNNYCSMQNVWRASKDINTILPIEYVKLLYGKSWIPAVQVNTRVEFFIAQFPIKDYTVEDFIDSLEKDDSFFDELFTEQTGNADYFKSLYSFLASAKERESNTSSYNGYYSPKKKTRNEILRSVKFLLCEDDDLHDAGDKIYLRTNYKLKNKLKNWLFLNLLLRNTEQDRRIKHFLLSFGNIKEMSESEEMFGDVSENSVSAADMIQKMAEIVEKYKTGSINILEFKGKPIFLAQREDHEIFVEASKCAWSKDLAFFFGGIDVLSRNKYKKTLKSDMSIFKQIFEKLGGKTKLVVVERRCRPVGQFKSVDMSRERAETCISEDYFFLGDNNEGLLAQIKTGDLKSASQLLWKFVLGFNNKRCFKAIYQPNRRVNEQYFESSLVYYLKRTEWVLTKSGEYKCPYQLTKDDLLDDFKYDMPSALLIEISKPPHDKAEQLRKSGISDENVLRFAELDSETQEAAMAYAQQLQAQKQRKGKSLSELAESSDRDQIPEEDDYDSYGYDKKPKNLDSRRIKLEKEFDDREQPETKIKNLKFDRIKPNSGEKIFVQHEYSSHCQICSKEGILTAGGKRYFEAINIFNTGKLDEGSQINLQLGWNTLSLCPDCATKFKYSQITISELLEQAEQIDVNSISGAFAEISFTLENKPTIIRFTPKHLLALQVAIKKLKQMESQEN